MMNGDQKKKAVYLGMDVLYECLILLEKRGYDVVQIFTMKDDDYDRTIRIQNYAKEHGIPCSTEKMTKEELTRLEMNGVELMVVAGYLWKLPISQSIRQVNIHPAYLPVGRGSWPMPVAILKGLDSGVTLHKLSEGLDEGDILLQEKIELGEQDHLESLLIRIRKAAETLLGQFLDNPDEIWNCARPQEDGEYWKEPDDTQRTFSLQDDHKRISTILRAFYGYGSLCVINGVPIEVIRGVILTEKKQIRENELLIRIWDGTYLHCLEWKVAFREIRLTDREQMEMARKKYKPQLSDYTFALLYCWQKNLKLSVYVEEDFYVVKGEDYYFFPIGSEERTKRFLDGLLSLGVAVKLRFCDEWMLAWLKETYSGNIRFDEAPEDGDYVVSNELMKELPGRHFASRRKDLAHYCRSLPVPEVEYLTPENQKYLKQISEWFSGADEAPELLAIDHLSELELFGVLVREGEEYVGFALCSKQDDETMQGHFMKCVSEQRGSGFYLLKACVDAFSERFAYTNMEDDMGQEGLRRFKSSFCPMRRHSFTVTFEKEELYERESPLCT